MRHDDLHVREVRGDLVEVERVGVLQQHASPAPQAGADGGLAGVEDRRELVLGDHLVERVGEPVVGEEGLQAGVELEAADVVLLDQPPRFATPSAPRCGSIETNGISASRSFAASSRISSLVTGPPQRTVSTMKQTAAILRSR